MRIWNELSIATEIVKYVFLSMVKWYKASRKNVIVSRCMKTPEGRKKLAEAMIGPILE